MAGAKVKHSVSTGAEYVVAVCSGLAKRAEDPHAFAGHQSCQERRVVRCERVPVRLADVRPARRAWDLGEHDERAVAADEDEVASRAEKDPRAREKQRQVEPEAACPMTRTRLPAPPSLGPRTRAAARAHQVSPPASGHAATLSGRRLLHWREHLVNSGLCGRCGPSAAAPVAVAPRTRRRRFLAR